MDESSFEAALDDRVNEMLDACIRCGKCVEACPTTEPTTFSIATYDLPPRERLGTIASVHEDTSSSAACATITVMKLDVSNVDQTRSAVAVSS
jgi:ferredoxin